MPHPATLERFRFMRLAGQVDRREEFEEQVREYERRAGKARHPQRRGAGPAQ